MIDTMTAELKGLGVPFFGTDESLTGEYQEQPAQWSPPVTQDELLNLQKRMIQYLEDLYGD